MLGIANEVFMDRLNSRKETYIIPMKKIHTKPLRTFRGRSTWLTSLLLVLVNIFKSNSRVSQPARACSWICFMDYFTDIWNENTASHKKWRIITLTEFLLWHNGITFIFFFPVISEFIKKVKISKYQWNIKILVKYFNIYLTVF